MSSSPRKMNIAFHKDKISKLFASICCLPSTVACSNTLHCTIPCMSLQLQIHASQVYSNCQKLQWMDQSSFGIILKWFCVAIKYGNLQFYKIHILPIVLKVSSTSPLLFSFVSFFGDGGRSASFFPFFFPGDFERFPADGLRPDFFPLSSFFPASAALAAC